MEKKSIIIYHGLVDDMREIYAKVHCVVHPTYYPEGLSNVLLEASASARPIITTNRSGCKEVVDDGMNGYFIKERDKNNLIEVIEKFLRLKWNDKNNMGILGREKVEREYDRKIVVQNYMNELIGNAYGVN